MSSYIAAPLLVLTCGVLRIFDGLDGERGPGPVWTVGHLVFLAALGFFTWIFQDMVRRIGPRGVVTDLGPITPDSGLAPPAWSTVPRPARTIERAIGISDVWPLDADRLGENLDLFCGPQSRSCRL